MKAVLNLTYGKTQSQKLGELIEYAACKTPITDVKPSNMLTHIKESVSYTHLTLPTICSV